MAFIPFKDTEQNRGKSTLKSWRIIPAGILAVLGIIVLNTLFNLIISAQAVLLVVVVLFSTVLHRVLVAYFGDVARYVRATPENVQKRHNIRERGLKLLRQLHQSGDYDRIIVVSHSLGTIVAYDLLSLLWAELGPTRVCPPSDAASVKITKLDNWLQQISEGKSDWDLNKFRAEQRNISRSLAKETATEGDVTDGACGWLISDFITMGSPLTHAEFLMADNTSKLSDLIKERTLAISPPQREASNIEGNEPSFTYFDAASAKILPHHAAMFSAVRWTNIFDKHNPFLPFLGDAISGPVSANFGNYSAENKDTEEGVETIFCGGIQEKSVRLPSSFRPIPRFFTHTKYWNWNDNWNPQDPPEHITVLRNAVNLADS